MSSFRELAYMCLDRLKLSSDDAYFNEEHMMFMLKKYRAVVIRKLIEEHKEDGLTSQELCIDLEQAYAIDGVPCEGIYLKSKQKIPIVLTGLCVYPESYFNTEIAIVSADRMRFVGHNKWLKNIIYATISPDRYLYIKSSNPQFLYLEKVRVEGIFEDPEEAWELQCCQCGSNCDPWDADFNLAEAYIPTVLDAIVQTFTAHEFEPEDKKNNASDDQSDFGRDAALAAAQKSAYKSLNPYKSLYSSKDDD